jgi:hypothetical protein
LRQPARLRELAAEEERRKPWDCDHQKQLSCREKDPFLGYPQPRGAAYLCCPVSQAPEPPHWLGNLDIGALRPIALGVGHPFAVSWAQLLDAGGA